MSVPTVSLPAALGAWARSLRCLAHCASVCWAPLPELARLLARVGLVCLRFSRDPNTPAAPAPAAHDDGGIAGRAALEVLALRRGSLQAGLLTDPRVIDLQAVVVASTFRRVFGLEVGSADLALFARISSVGWLVAHAFSTMGGGANGHRVRFGLAVFTNSLRVHLAWLDSGNHGGDASHRFGLYADRFPNAISEAERRVARTMRQEERRRAKHLRRVAAERLRLEVYLRTLEFVLAHTGSRPGYCRRKLARLERYYAH